MVNVMENEQEAYAMEFFKIKRKSVMVNIDDEVQNLTKDLLTDKDKAIFEKKFL